jgi:hypothetical protein
MPVGNPRRRARAGPLVLTSSTIAAGVHRRARGAGRQARAMGLVIAQAQRVDHAAALRRSAGLAGEERDLLDRAKARRVPSRIAGTSAGRHRAIAITHAVARSTSTSGSSQIIPRRPGADDLDLDPPRRGLGRGSLRPRHPRPAAFRGAVRGRRRSSCPRHLRHRPDAPPSTRPTTRPSTIAAGPAGAETQAIDRLDRHAPIRRRAAPVEPKLRQHRLGQRVAPTAWQASERQIFSTCRPAGASRKSW